MPRISPPPGTRAGLHLTANGRQPSSAGASGHSAGSARPGTGRQQRSSVSTVRPRPRAFSAASLAHQTRFARSSRCPAGASRTKRCSSGVKKVATNPPDRGSTRPRSTPRVRREPSSPGPERVAAHSACSSAWLIETLIGNRSPGANRSTGPASGASRA